MVQRKNPNDPTILDWIVDVEKGLFSPLITVLSKTVSAAIMTSIQGSSSPLEDISAALAGFIDHMAKAGAFGVGPTLAAHAVNALDLKKATVTVRTPESAKATLDSAGASYQVGAATLIGLTTAASAIPFGSIGDAVDEVWRLPSVEAAMDIAREAFLMEYRTGVYPLLRRYWNKQYLPFIPSVDDLRLMAVREAFPVEPGLPQYQEMEKWAIQQGLDPYWTERYYLAGFIRMDLRQAYENLWRGFWTPDQFQFYLRIADIHPDDREPVTRVAFRPPGVREMGYGYDTGMYSVEDIVKYRRWGGLSLEDAEKAGKAMVAYRTEAEREALRREAISDFENWLDDEAQLRANLKAIGGRDEIVDLWVWRAKYRQHRDWILENVKIEVDQFVKNLIDEKELDVRLIELGIVSPGREQIEYRAKVRRAAYQREATVEKHRLLTEAKVGQARALGLIGDAEYVRRLIAANYTEDDAKLLLAIELTPRLITPEEVERRKATITSRLNKARRRWEDRLLRITNQIELAAMQRDDASTIMTEALDVFDAQLEAYERLIEVTPEEERQALWDRHMVVFRRREEAVARWTARIRKLVEQHKDLQEQKTLMTRQRDEELSEYEEELKLLEVAG